MILKHICPARAGRWREVLLNPDFIGRILEFESHAKNKKVKLKVVCISTHLPSGGDR